MVTDRALHGLRGSEPSVASLGTVLGVWAHPDDETFLSAGLMFLARTAGNDVVCATATSGEHGTDDPLRWPPDRLAPVRDAEHAESLRLLGVPPPRHLGYCDGFCSEVPLDEGAARVAELIAELKPETVVTFGPDGMTGHPDHRAVNAWTTEAVRRTRVASRLLYATMTPEIAASREPTSLALGVFDDGYPTTTPATDLALHLRLEEPELTTKLAALRAHASQTASQERLVGTDAYRRWVAEEMFVAAR